MGRIQIPKEIKDYILDEFFYDSDEKQWAKKAMDYIEGGNYPYYSQENYNIQKVKKGHFVSFSNCTTIDDAIKVLENLKSQGYKRLIPDYCSLDGEGDFVYKFEKESKYEYAGRLWEIIKDAIYTVKRKANEEKLEKIKNLENQIKEIKVSLY